MRLNQELLVPLFNDLHMVQMACLFFRMRCLAHRLINFGFESFVNELDARELLVLACLMPQYQHDALVTEAYRKGDVAIQFFICEHVPHVCAEVTSGL